MIIRRAKVEDIPGVHRLLKQVNAVHHQGRPDLFKEGESKYTDEEVQAIFENERTPVFVAVEDDKVLGYAFTIFQQYVNHHIMTDIKTLYIDDLCVDENIRGQHVGQSLYEHVLTFAKEQGFYNITLNVWALNEGAIQFYKKCGLVIQKIGMEKIL